MMKNLTSMLVASMLVLGMVSSVHAASVPVDAPVPDRNPEAQVSKINNTLTASKQSNLVVGETITWTARAQYDNVAWGSIPPLPYRSNFVVRVTRHHFPIRPRITSSTLPDSCSANWTAVGNTWEMRCPTFWVVAGDTLTVNFTTVVGGDRLNEQWDSYLMQDIGSRGSRSTVTTGG